MKLESYLKYRNEIIPKFRLDTKYDNYTEYRDAYYKICGNLNDEVRNFFEWEIELLRLNEGYEHIINQEEGVRLLGTKIFGNERVLFYKSLLECTSDMFIRVRIFDFLLDIDTEKDKYSIAKNLISEIDLLINDTLLSGFSEGSLGHTYLLSQVSRFVDIVVRYNMKDKFELASNHILTICKKYPYNWLQQYSKLLRYLCYYKKKKRIPQNDVNEMIELLKMVKENGRKINKFLIPTKFSNELVQWYKYEKKDKEEIRKEELFQADFFICEANNQPGKRIKSSLIEAHFKEIAAKKLTEMGESEKARKVMVQIKNAYDRADKFDEYDTIEEEVPIDVSVYETMYNDLSGNNVIEKFECFSNSLQFVPKIKDINRITKDRMNQMPMKNLFDTHNIKSNRKISTASTEEEKINLEFYNNYSIFLSFNALRLSYVWDRLVKDGLLLENIKDRILAWNFIDNEKKKIIEKGLECFWAEEYISAMHILAPQFESLFREFFHAGDNSTTVLRKGRTQQEQTFNSFLENEFVQDKMNEDYLFYIKFLFVDEMGLNIRNDIAHGLVRLKDINKENTLLLVKAFFLLTMNNWE